MSNKLKVLELQNQGKTYQEIHEITGLAKGTISYHCQRAGISRSGISAEEYKAKEVKRLRATKRAIKAKAVVLMGGKCTICGYNKCVKALDFHHTNPSEKDFNISKSSSWKKAKEEIKKCILVCKNCHAELHE
jgi:5-methylcytosine-specific restriction endonuclease McrA